MQAHMLAATSSLHEEHQSPVQNTIRELLKPPLEYHFVIAKLLETLQKGIVDLLLQPLPEDLNRGRTFVQQADPGEQLFLIEVEL